MRHILGILTALMVLPNAAQAFCGFYVGQADADLFNRASKVVYAHIGDTSTITMASDYEGPLNEFAMVVPVPTILEETDVRTVDPAIIDHLDRYSAPRLVEYNDPDPCNNMIYRRDGQIAFASVAESVADAAGDMPAPTVTIERSFEVDGYAIQILSATESDGLLTWLNQNGYQTPEAALPVLADYVEMGMKFFVAQVSLDAQESAESLNPLQVTFESDAFMLPIRLGMVNAPEGESQELVAWFLTNTGQVEVKNYVTAKIPTDANIPESVRDDFGTFYQDVFATAHHSADKASVFMEYGWDMGWCDPCAADPLSEVQLFELGIPQGMQPYVTRLHMRYEAATHPDDLMLVETGDRTNFQGRYIIQNAFDVPFWNLFRACARNYLTEVRVRQEREQETLEDITGVGFLASVTMTPSHPELNPEEVEGEEAMGIEEASDEPMDTLITQ